MGSDLYQVNLYYHGRLEQQFTGQILNRLLAKLHHCVERFSSGAVGTIVDIEAQKIVHSCAYSTTSLYNLDRLNCAGLSFGSSRLCVESQDVSRLAL